jgi:hypothetical protein
MYGELNIKPWELHRMTLRDVLLAIDGLREKDLYNQALIRRATLIIASALGGKRTAGAINRLWPMPKAEGERTLQDRAKEVLTRFKEVDDKKKVKNIIDARGIKASSNR